MESISQTDFNKYAFTTEDYDKFIIRCYKYVKYKGAAFWFVKPKLYGNPQQH